MEDELPGHKAWAGRVSAAPAGQARVLHAHDWAARACGPVIAPAARLDTARAQWAKTAGAENGDTFCGRHDFYERYDTAMQLVAPRQAVTARKALGPATTPPGRDDDRSDTGMRV
ncbi:hypothetical protein [Streptomyces sp. NPDC096012]|uniref:hypothetical protein n=1 Tax=Streptomyces sp. NPDC096012 TaxID=3155684 RepID=UPI00336A36E1